MKLRVFVFALLFLAAPDLGAQRRGGVTIEITLPPEGSLSRDAPVVATSNPLAKKDAEDLLRNGFPARLTYRAELWPASGLVGRAASTVTWEVYVEYEPLEKIFRIVRYTLGEFQSLGSFASFADVMTVLSRGYQPRLRAPSQPGSYFYTVTLEVERMTANDLAKLRSWMGTATRPQDNPGKSLVGFLTGIFASLIGAGKEGYKAQTAVFTVR